MINYSNTVEYISLYCKPDFLFDYNSDILICNACMKAIIVWMYSYGESYLVIKVWNKACKWLKITYRRPKKKLVKIYGMKVRVCKELVP